MLGLGIGTPYNSLVGQGGSPPENVVAPVLSGIPLQGETLTCSEGTWDGTPPISYLYSFYRNGVTLLQQSASNSYIPVSGDVGNTISCLVDASNAFGTGFSGSNSLAISAADLINLQSYDASKFTLSGSQITEWRDQDAGRSAWVQASAGKRPTLVSGVPTFAGAANGTCIQRASGDITGIGDFSWYAVVRNTGKTNNSALYCNIGSNVSWYNSFQSTYVSGEDIVIRSAHTGNRVVVVHVKRQGTTVKGYSNERDCIITGNSIGISETISIGALMGMTHRSDFSINGVLQSFIMDNSYHTDEQSMSIISQLYDKYNLGANTATDSAIFMGDSNTVGTNSISYAIGLSTQIGLKYTNNAISGSGLTPLAGIGANSVYTNRARMFTRPGTDWIIIMAGTNEVLNGVSAANYELYYNLILDELINDVGHDPNKIILCTAGYQRSNANAASLDALASVVDDMRTTYGTKWFDTLNWMRANGGDSLLNSGDNVHFNQTCQNGIQAQLYTIMTT